MCPPDEDTLTLAWEAGTAALDAAGIDADHVDALFWGTRRPPFAEGPSHAFLAAALGCSSHVGRRAARRVRHTPGMDALTAAADAVAAGSRPDRARDRVRRPPARPGHRLRSPLRCRRGRDRARARAAAPRRSARASPAAVRSSTATAATARTTSATSTTARLFREEIFLPVVAEVATALASFDVRAWSLPDPDGRLGATVAKLVGGGAPASTRGVRRGRRHRRGRAAARRDRRARRAGPRRRSSAPAVAARPASSSTSRRRSPAPRSSLDALDGGDADVATRRRCAHAGQLVADGRDDPDGRAAGERDVRARRRRDARPARWPLRRLRHDQHAAVDPSDTASRAAARSSNRSRSRVSGSVHTYVVNHTMPAPFVAPLPIAVLDMDDGARLMLQVIGDGQRRRDRRTRRPGAAQVRARTRRPRLRLQGRDRSETSPEERNAQ